jgi:hypothetical protein
MAHWNIREGPEDGHLDGDIRSIMLTNTSFVDFMESFPIDLDVAISVHLEIWRNARN